MQNRCSGNAARALCSSCAPSTCGADLELNRLWQDGRCAPRLAVRICLSHRLACPLFAGDRPSLTRPLLHVLLCLNLSLSPSRARRAVMRAESAALSTYYSAVRPFRERGAPHPRRTMWEAKPPPVMPLEPLLAPQPRPASDPIPRTQERTRTTPPACRRRSLAQTRALRRLAWPALARSGIRAARGLCAESLA